MEAGDPFLVCRGCAQWTSATAGQAPLPQLFHGLYTLVEYRCPECTGTQGCVVNPAASQVPIKRMSRVLLFDRALRTGQAFQRIRDIGDAMKENWGLLFGSQRKMPKTLASSVSASITTAPTMFQRHAVDNTWAVIAPTEHFPEYQAICPELLHQLEEEAMAQAPGAQERSAAYRRQRLEQLEQRQRQQSTLAGRSSQTRLSPRQQMMEQAQLLSLGPLRHKEPKEDPLPPEDLVAVMTGYFAEYCRMVGISDDVPACIAQGAGVESCLLAKLLTAGGFAAWEVFYLDMQRDAASSAKKPRLDTGDAGTRFLAALQMSTAVAGAPPSHYAPQRSLAQCIAQKVARYHLLPLPEDFGRSVQSRLRSTSTADEEMHRVLYLQKWRAWVRSGGGACAVPMVPPRPSSPVLGDAAADTSRADLLPSDPFRVGADPQRALLVDHLVLCEEVEDCQASAARAAYTHLAKYLRELYHGHRQSAALSDPVATTAPDPAEG